MQSGGHRHAGHALALTVLAGEQVTREQRHAAERRQAILVVILVHVEERLPFGLLTAELEWLSETMRAFVRQCECERGW